jgi:hypothetical protein
VVTAVAVAAAARRVRDAAAAGAGAAAGRGGPGPGGARLGRRRDAVADAPRLRGLRRARRPRLGRRLGGVGGVAVLFGGGRAVACGLADAGGLGGGGGGGGNCAAGQWRWRRVEAAARAAAAAAGAERVQLRHSCRGAAAGEGLRQRRQPVARSDKNWTYMSLHSCGDKEICMCSFCSFRWILVSKMSKNDYFDKYD